MLRGCNNKDMRINIRENKRVLVEKCIIEKEGIRVENIVYK